MANLFKRSNGIYYEITHFHGPRIWRSKGARSLAQAKEAIARGFKQDAPRANLTLSEFSTQFQPNSQTNFAPSTLALYEQSARTFVRLIGDYQLKAYSIQDVKAYKSKRSKEVSAVNVNIDFRILRALIQTAVKWKLISTRPQSTS